MYVATWWELSHLVMREDNSRSCYFLQIIDVQSLKDTWKILRLTLTAVFVNTYKHVLISCYCPLFNSSSSQGNGISCHDFQILGVMHAVYDIYYYPTKFQYKFSYCIFLSSLYQCHKMLFRICKPFNRIENFSLYTKLFYF